MTSHVFKTSPGGMSALDSTLAPPGVIETDPTTRHVPSMLRIHVQDAQLPAGCNPYAMVSVGSHSARSKQLLSCENAALASTGYAFFDEQFIVEYDPRHAKDTFISVAFFERTNNAPLGEWRAPISNYDHTSHGLFSHFGKHTTPSGGASWELVEGVNVPLAPYVGPMGPTGATHGIHRHHKTETTTTTTVTAPVTTTAVPMTTTTTPAATTVPVVTTAAPVTTTAVPVATTAPVGTTTGALPLASGVLGIAHVRVRSEPKLIGTLKLGVREVLLSSGSVAPIALNIKFASPEQRFSIALTSGVTGGRFAFAPNEFLLRVDPSNNVRDVFIEVIQNGVILGETRVTLYDAYRPGGLAAAQPIIVHSTRNRIGDMILTSSFEGKLQKR